MANRYIPEEHLRKICGRLRGVDRIITEVLLATGFRLDDIMHLRTWELRRETLTIRERKTGHVRSVRIPEEVRERLAVHLRKRNPFRYAFPALRSGGKAKMHRTTYWRHFMAAVKACGLRDEGYSPHSLRKVYAVRRFAETGSLSKVQADLGHTKPEVTMIYAFSDRL